jgi:hypothetical protein
MLKDQWSSMVWPASNEAVKNPDTGLPAEHLQHIGRASVAVPDGFVSFTGVLNEDGLAKRGISGDPSEITTAC